MWVSCGESCTRSLLCTPPCPFVKQTGLCDDTCSGVLPLPLEALLHTHNTYTQTHVYTLHICTNRHIIIKHNQTYLCKLGTYHIYTYRYTVNILACMYIFTQCKNPCRYTTHNPYTCIMHTTHQHTHAVDICPDRQQVTHIHVNSFIHTCAHILTCTHVYTYIAYMSLHIHANIHNTHTYRPIHNISHITHVYMYTHICTY